MPKPLPFQSHDKYRKARQRIDEKAYHIWCITAMLSMAGNEGDESLSIDPHVLKYWMKSVAQSVGEIVEVLDGIEG